MKINPAVKFRIIWVAGWLLIYAVIFAFLVLRYFPILGSTTYVYRFDEKNYGISLLSPNDRVAAPVCDNGSCSQELLGDPVYFKVRTPIHYSTAKIIVEYQSENLPVVELGVTKPDHTGATMRPVEHAVLDSLISSGNYAVQQNAGFIFLQKKLQFGTVDDFLDNMPPNASVATYNYQLPWLVPTEKIAKEVTIHPYIMGGTNFWVVVPDKPLEMDFTFAAETEAKVTVYDNAGKSTGCVVEMKQTGKLTCTAPTGVYRVEVVTRPEQVLETIKTNAPKIVVDKSIQISSIAPVLQLVSETNQLFVQALIEQGIQTVQINNEPHAIAARQTMYPFTFENFNRQTVILAHGGVEVASGSMIGFSQETYFNPFAVNFRTITSIDHAELFDYIIAQYEPPVEVNGWKRQTVEIPIKNAIYEHGELTFVISLPGFDAGKSRFRVRLVDVELMR